MKNALVYLQELVPNRRYFPLIVNAAALAAVTAALSFAYLDGSLVRVAINAFCVGLLLSSTIATLMMPGMFRQIAEADAAIMRAQLEKQFHAAYEDFIKEHPEMRDIVRPTRVTQ